MILCKIKAFTLIELLVWISVLSIIAILGMNIDYNRLSQKQELNIFVDKVKSHYENTRNRELAWKWIWIELNIPDLWKIEYSKINSWTIISNAYSWTSIIDNNDIILRSWYSIEWIKCWEINEDESLYDTLEDSLTWSLEFSKWKIYIDWWVSLECSSNTDKIIELDLKYKLDTKKIIINTINWLIEIK